MSLDESLAKTAIEKGSELGLKFECDVEIALRPENGLIDKRWKHIVWDEGECDGEFFVIRRYSSTQDLSYDLYDVASKKLPDDAELDREFVEISRGRITFHACYLSKEKSGFIEICAYDKYNIQSKHKIHDADLRELEASVITAIYDHFG